MTLALLWKLAKSPWVWLAILLTSNVVTVALWRRAAGEVAVVEAACEAARLEAVNAALTKQAEGWASVYQAQQEAVARMAQEAGVAAANAREWKRRYDAAKQTPACQKWLTQPVECPVE